MAVPELRPGRYRHYKGQDYAVFQVARHSETEEVVVVYRQLYGEFGWWIRPHAMFTGTVLVDGVEQPRFAYVGPLDTAAFTGAAFIESGV